jgi:hypothetical protein
MWPLVRFGAATHRLPLPDARLGEIERSCQHDVAAFLVDDTTNLFPLPLATRPPEAGEAVWLAPNGAASASGGVHAASVVQQTGRMIFRFAPGTRLPRHASGAPSLDARGEVVGINIGGGQLAGRTFGHGVHAASVRAR